MAGSLIVPNVIAQLPGPRQPANKLDQNWTAVADYVNERQITFDVLANLPAAGTAGAYYYATDTGALYADNGAEWIQISTSLGGGGGASPFAASLAQVSDRLTATTFQLTAEAVVTVNATSGIAHTHNPVSNLTVDLTVVGANGRDQAGALSANSWAYLYWIYNPSTFTLASLVSAASWPTTLPTLPSGYTELCFAGAVRLNASAQFELMQIRGAWTYWGTGVTVLNAGTASAVTSFSTATAVPPNAQSLQGTMFMQNTTDPGSLVNVRGQLLYSTTLTNSVFALLAYKCASGATNGAADANFFRGANILQSISYQVTDFAGAAVAGTNQLTVAITAFENPNGGN